MAAGRVLGAMQAWVGSAASGLALMIGMALTVGLAPAAAHQPVNLTTTHARVDRSPILVDGTVSFAVTASFTKAKQSRYFRFVLAEGDQLKAEYLILDKLPERNLRQNQLPQVRITSPSGRAFYLAINERTPFYEPFGRQNYFFLSRINRPAEPGVYTVKVTSRVKSAALVAVGAKEVRGEVLRVGEQAGTCPVALPNEIEITDARAKQLVGMSERGATSCSAVNAWLVRVADRDGEPQALTKDYRRNRVNLTVVSDRVTDVYVG